MKLDIKFLQSGGVPLTNDVMSDIMSAISIYDVLGELAGNLTILSGCIVNGQNISPGIVAIEGSVLYFEGGNVVDTVFINTEKIKKTFQDQNDKELIEKKTVRFGNGSINYNWSDFIRLDSLKKIQGDVGKKAEQSQVTNHEERIKILEMKTAPIDNGGVAFIFRKPVSSIPPGWKECLDLRGKTIFGWNPSEYPFNNLNTDIGSKSKTIERTNLPNIRLGTGLYTNGAGYTDDWPNDNIGMGVSGSEIKTEALGNATPMDVLNPGRIILFIEPNFQ